MSEAAGFDPSPQLPQTPAEEAAARFRSYITWGVPQLIVGAVGTLILIFLISTVIVLPVSNEYGEKAPETYGASAIATILWDFCYVGMAYLLVRRTGGGFANLGLRRGVFILHDVYDNLRRRLHSMSYLWLPRLPLIVVSGYVAAYASVLVYNLLITLFGLSFLEPDQQLPTELFDSDIVVAITGIAVVFVTPVTEEILFRGFLFGGLRRLMPLWPAALVSGFIFSSAHANLGLVVPFTLIGIVLAYTYERSGTLFASMGVHFIFNGVSFSFLLLFPELRS